MACVLACVREGGKAVRARAYALRGRAREHARVCVGVHMLSADEHENTRISSCTRTNPHAHARALQWRPKVHMLSADEHENQVSMR